MTLYIARRLALAVPTIVGVVTLVFLLIHLIPGDPVEVMLGESAMAADRAALRQELGLDRPIPTQYARYMEKLAHGDLGWSLHSRRPVMGMIAERLPATLELALAGLVVAMLLAVPLGLCAAARPGSAVDNLSVGTALIGAAIPSFWLGPMLMLLFGVWLGWLPVAGRAGIDSLVLPGITLGSGMAALLTRLLRASMLERLREDYVRTGHSKGASTLRVFVRHALPNALLPVVTVLGLQAGALLSGAIITETIFNWPGLGRLTLMAIGTRDYPLVQGCVLVIALMYVAVNVSTDLLYAWIDPRIRLYRREGK